MIFTCALGARVVIRIKSTKTEHKPIYFHSKPSTNMATINQLTQLKPTRHVTMKELYTRYRMSVTVIALIICHAPPFINIHVHHPAKNPGSAYGAVVDLVKKSIRSASKMCGINYLTLSRYCKRLTNRR